MQAERPILSNTGQQIAGLAYAPKKPPEEMMATFDLLPAQVRQAIAECPYRFNVDAALSMCRKGWPAEKIAAHINDAGKHALALAKAEASLRLTGEL